MGLDVYHFKATLTKPTAGVAFFDNYFTESNFEGFDVGFDYFGDYVQEIEVAELPQKSFIFVKREVDLDALKRYFNRHEEDSNIVLYEPDASSIDSVVSRYVVENRLGDLHLCKKETMKWHLVQLYDIIKVTGFYVEEVGHQRKGMNRHFYEYFKAALDTVYCYTKKSDFEYALSCVDYYWKEDTEEIVAQRKLDFHENFVGSYKEGCSWLEISM